MPAPSEEDEAQQNFVIKIDPVLRCLSVSAGWRLKFLSQFDKLKVTKPKSSIFGFFSKSAETEIGEKTKGSKSGSFEVQEHNISVDRRDTRFVVVDRSTTENALTSTTRAEKEEQDEDRFDFENLMGEMTQGNTRCSDDGSEMY